MSTTVGNWGDKEDKTGAVTSVIFEANGPDQPAGVMQEPSVPLEGFQGDVDVRTEEQTESRA